MDGKTRDQFVRSLMQHTGRSFIDTATYLSDPGFDELGPLELETFLEKAMAFKSDEERHACVERATRHPEFVQAREDIVDFVLGSAVVDSHVQTAECIVEAANDRLKPEELRRVSEVFAENALNLQRQSVRLAQLARRRDAENAARSRGEVLFQGSDQPVRVL